MAFGGVGRVLPSPGLGGVESSRGWGRERVEGGLGERQEASGRGGPRPRGGWAASLRGSVAVRPGRAPPKQVAEVFGGDCVASVLHAPFSPITDLMEPSGQGVG